MSELSTKEQERLEQAIEAEKNKPQGQKLQEQAQRYSDNALKLVDEQTKRAYEGANSPIDLSKGAIFNPDKKAQELKAKGLDSQTSLYETQSQEETPSDMVESVRYQKYRNTGVDYFDKKEHLSLLDAYMAKQLGLNVSYNFHKIDMKVNNSTKAQNYTQLYNKGNRGQSSGLKMLVAGLNQVVAENKKDQGYIKQIAGMKLDRLFGAGLNLNSDLRANQQVYKDAAIEVSALGSAMGAGNAKAQAVNELVGDYSDAGRLMQITASYLPNAIIEMETSLRGLSANGMTNKAQILNLQNTINSFKHAQAILSSTDANNKEQIKQNALKIMSVLSSAGLYF